MSAGLNQSRPRGQRAANRGQRDRDQRAQQQRGRLAAAAAGPAGCRSSPRRPARRAARRPATRSAPAGPISRATRWAARRARAEQQPKPDEGRAVAEVAQVERRAEPDEEQRPEQPLGDREQLLGHPARLADRGGDQAEAEPGQQDRDVRRLASAARPNSTIRLIRSSRANSRFSESRCTRRRQPLSSTQRSASERDRGAGDHRQRAERRPSGVGRVDGQRQRDDAGGVGERDLRAAGRARAAPPSRSESTIGRISAADDDAISTA